MYSNRRCAVKLGRPYLTAVASRSDYSGSHTKLPKILLNGNNICMVKFRVALHEKLGTNVKPADPWRRRADRGRGLI